MIPPTLVLTAYRHGLFPMAMDDGEIGWFSPDPRGVLPLDRFHVPSRLARTLRRGPFEIRIDTDFAGVLAACAEQREDGTWISDEIAETYTTLHQLGAAHSVEAWHDNRLVGGLYGVHIGGAFFGESMFHRVTDASKVTLVALVRLLVARGFLLLDTQWVTAHLRQFGAVEIPRASYVRMLKKALVIPCQFPGAGPVNEPYTARSA